MLSKSEQSKFIGKKCKKAKLHLEKFFLAHNPEELHKLRIEIKKIKALLFFLSKCRKKKISFSDFPHLRKLFKDAGKVRSAQVNLSFIDKYKMPASIKQQQQKLFTDSITKFLLKKNEHLSAIHKDEEAFGQILMNMKDKSLLHVYYDQLKKIEEAFGKTNDTNELHTCRKKIKALLSIEAILSNKTKKDLQLNTEYLDKTQQIIGTWHDTILAAGLLKTPGNIHKGNITLLEKKTDQALKRSKLFLKNFTSKAIMQH